MIWRQFLEKSFLQTERRTDHFNSSPSIHLSLGRGVWGGLYCIYLLSVLFVYQWNIWNVLVTADFDSEALWISNPAFQSELLLEVCTMCNAFSRIIVSGANIIILIDRWTIRMCFDWQSCQWSEFNLLPSTNYTQFFWWWLLHMLSKCWSLSTKTLTWMIIFHLLLNNEMEAPFDFLKCMFLNIYMHRW